MALLRAQVQLFNPCRMRVDSFWHWRCQHGRTLFVHKLVDAGQGSQIERRRRREGKSFTTVCRVTASQVHHIICTNKRPQPPMSELFWSEVNGGYKLSRLGCGAPRAADRYQTPRARS
jgi:hypothetical protein